MTCRHTISIRSDGPSAQNTSTSMATRSVRQGHDGTGAEFAFRHETDEQRFQTVPTAIAAHPPLPPWLALPSHSVAPGRDVAAGKRGQALIEFALIIPLVFLLAVNAVNFGAFIFAWITVADAARAGAQYMVMSSASTGSAARATNAQITALVQNETTSLLNRASIVVATCVNSTSSATACTTLVDPEAPAYTLAAVDVTYTFKPPISLFSFPGLGIGATLPSASIHRKAVMRLLQ